MIIDHEKDVLFINDLPKAELHVHLEGTLEPQLMLELAQRNSIKLPYKNIQEIRDARIFHNYEGFWESFQVGTSVI